MYQEYPGLLHFLPLDSNLASKMLTPESYCILLGSGNFLMFEIFEDLFSLLSPAITVHEPLKRFELFALQVHVSRYQA